MDKERILYQFLDLTSLKPTDTEDSIAKWVGLEREFARDMGQVAGICVYPTMLGAVKKAWPQVTRVAVAGGFPDGQVPLDDKLQTVRSAIEAGAHEVDVVVPVGMASEPELIRHEVAEMKSVCDGKVLKVILESGLYNDMDLLKMVSRACLDSGADFLKTSTGKNGAGADHHSVKVMCEAIWDHYQQTGQRRGIKVSGGVGTTEDAWSYYQLVGDRLGHDWLSTRTFRIGASSLAGVLREAVIG